jgi:predicted phage terminase large subunit-like protein
MSKQLTNREFDKKLQGLIKGIKKHATAFVNDTLDKQRLRKKRALVDTEYFAKTYFPHYIRAPFGDIHREMFKETDVVGQITAIVAFRGAGKTTNLSIIKPIQKSLNGSMKFNVKIAKSDDKAKERSAAIKAEFLYNERLKQDFGEQVRPNASDSDFTTKEDCRFLAIGYKTGLRGVINMAHRPDYIDIDDLEDHESFNELIAKKKLEFVTEEAYGAFEDGEGILVWLGNLTHQKSALNLFKKSTETDEYPGRKMLLYKIDDGNFNPTWPEKHTKKIIKRIYGAIGKFGFERHFRMNPVIEGLKFKEAWFKYYDPEDIRNIVFDKIVTYTDPSLGEKSTSDYKATVTLGFHKGFYYLLECRIRKESILSMLRWMYTIRKKYKCSLFMEDNFWQSILWKFIPKLAEKYGYNLPVIGITNTINKDLRIEGTSTYYEWGWILWPREMTEDMLILRDQYLGWPDFPNDDGPDAMAGALTQVEDYNPISEEDYETIEARESTALEQLG